MMSVEELIWLYKLALQFDLSGEKEWLKLEIEADLERRPGCVIPQFEKMGLSFDEFGLKTPQYSDFDAA